MNLNKKINNKNVKIFFLAFIGFVLIIISIIYAKPVGDEKLYHLPTLLEVVKNPLTVIFSNKYIVANTPLPYYIVYMTNILYPVNLFSARIITFLFSVLTIFMSYLFLDRLIKLDFEKNFFILIILSFYPNFIICAYSFYIPNFGLFFALLFLYLFDYQKTLLNNFLSGIILCSAVLSQQFYLAIYPALFITIMLNKNFKIKYFLSFVFVTLFLIIPLIIFIKWGGITNEMYRFYGISFTPQNLTSILIVVGFYLMPVFIFYLRNIKIYLLILSLILSLLLVIGFFPDYSTELYKGSFSGLVFRTISTTGIINKLIPQCVSFLFVAVGVYVIINYQCLKYSKHETIVYLTSLFLIVVYFFSEVLYEKHLLPLIFFLYIIYLPKLSKKILMNYSIFIFILGLIYYYYWYFLKVFNE